MADRDTRRYFSHLRSIADNSHREADERYAEKRRKEKEEYDRRVKRNDVKFIGGGLDIPDGFDNP